MTEQGTGPEELTLEQRPSITEVHPNTEKSTKPHLFVIGVLYVLSRFVEEIVQEKDSSNLLLNNTLKLGILLLHLCLNNLSLLKIVESINMSQELTIGIK